MKCHLYLRQDALSMLSSTSKRHLHTQLTSVHESQLISWDKPIEQGFIIYKNGGENCGSKVQVAPQSAILPSCQF